MRTTQIRHFHSICDQLKCVPDGDGVGRATEDLWEGFLKYGLREGVVNGKIEKMSRPLLKNLNLKLCLKKKINAKRNGRLNNYDPRC